LVVAVCVFAPRVALSVKTTVAGALCENVPMTVPEVYGEPRVVGELMPSVLLIDALLGVAV
jgi:hypothetical protein